MRRRDRGVAVDHLRRHAAHGLDAQAERGHVEEQDVLDLAGQYARLDRGTDRHHLVGVDALVRLLAAEHLLHGLDDRRHAGHAADEDHLVDVSGLHAGIGQCLLDRLGGLRHEIGDEVIQLGAREVEHEVLGPGRIGADKRQVDLGRGRARQLDLGLLGRLLQALQGDAVLGEVDALGLLELLAQPVDDPLVEVIAAEVGVAIGRSDLEDALRQLEDRCRTCRHQGRRRRLSSFCGRARRQGPMPSAR